jgi:prevent-host-death family protein
VIFTLREGLRFRYNRWMKVSVKEAKSRFPDMLDRVALGEEVVITDEGEPIAKLVPIPKASKKNRRFRFGSAKGEFTVPDDFNDPLPKEIEDLFW